MTEKTKVTGFAGMLAIMLAGMIVTMLNQSIINIALPQIMTQFNITVSTAQWLSTAYLLLPARHCHPEHKELVVALRIRYSCRGLPRRSFSVPCSSKRANYVR